MSPCPAPTSSRGNTALSTQCFLQDQHYHVCVLSLTAQVRVTKEGLCREIQRQESISTGLERARRCTGKVQDHGDGAGMEVSCKKSRTRLSDPTWMPWDVSLTWSPSLGKMIAWGLPRPPGSARVAVDRGRHAATGCRLPSPPSPGWLWATLRPTQICWITAISGGGGVCYCWKVHILSFNQIKCICGLHNHLQALIIFFCLALH